MIFLNMKKLLFILIGGGSLAANPLMDYQPEQKIAVQNAILTKVNGNTISMMDVKKKMDVIFFQNYPEMAESSQARYQFYEASWRHVLRDMIDNELIIADALDKEIKLTDGEIREAVEERFGPNMTETLDKIGLTPEEARKMIKNEMIVQRMSWWFVQQKALTSVTPQDIRQAYRLYIKEHPAYSEWSYRVVSIRSQDEASELVNQVYSLLTQSGKTPEQMENELKELSSDTVKISISNEYTAKTEDLSEAHRASIEPLEPGTYSKPTFQVSRRDKSAVHRIFYLVGKNDFSAPTFEQMSGRLRDELVQKAAMEESQDYISKLRKHYGYDGKESVPDDLNPFALQ